MYLECQEKDLRRKMSFALGDFAARFKYFHGIWIVSKTKVWETTVCLQLLQNPELSVSSRQFVS